MDEGWLTTILTTTVENESWGEQQVRRLFRHDVGVSLQQIALAVELVSSIASSTFEGHPLKNKKAPLIPERHCNQKSTVYAYAKTSLTT